MGLSPLCAAQMATVCTGFKRLSPAQQKKTLAVMNDTSPGSLYQIAKQTGYITDDQIKTALGFDDGTRGREGVPLHQKRAVQLNAPQFICEALVKAAEEKKAAAEAEEATQINSILREAEAQRKLVLEALKQEDKYCWCGRGDPDDSYYQCDSNKDRKRYCPFRGSVHPDCCAQLGHVVSDDEDTPYFCWFCESIPQGTKITAPRKKAEDKLEKAKKLAGELTPEEAQLLLEHLTPKKGQ